MLETIIKCKKCGLCQHQAPLLDETKTCQVFWVGLSAKKVIFEGEKPLSPSTNSGSILCSVEEHCDGIGMYRTNLALLAKLNFIFTCIMIYHTIFIRIEVMVICAGLLILPKSL